MSGTEKSSIERAARGKEITGLDIFKETAEDTPMDRILQLLDDMHADQPAGGTEIIYGKQRDTHKLRFWPAAVGSVSDRTRRAPLIFYIHGGSWSAGTYLDSTGSAKVGHLTAQGYAFASVNFTLAPEITVRDQVQEIAGAIAFLAKNAADLGVESSRFVLMGHSSGAHVAALLGTDHRYLKRAGSDIGILAGVVALDGSNYNVPAEVLDSPGSVADNALKFLGSDPKELEDMSPTHHARVPNADAFLLLHVERSGDIRQAVELRSALRAAGTDADLHVFEGDFFEGHVQMLLRLGREDYPATAVLDRWLMRHVPVVHEPRQGDSTT